MFGKARKQKSQKRIQKRIFVVFLDFGGFGEDLGSYGFCYLS